MEAKRDGVGSLFNNYVSSKTRLVDTQDLATVNAPKKRGRKRKILTDQETLEKKERRRCQNQKAAQTLRNKRERQMNELKEQVESLTKQKGQLEALVQQLQDEKKTYLFELQTQTKTTSSAPKKATTPGKMIESTTKNGVTFESAALVDMPSGVTHDPSLLMSSMFLVYCLIQLVSQWCLPNEAPRARPHSNSHTQLQLSLPIPSSIPTNHYLIRLLIFLSILSHRSHPLHQKQGPQNQNSRSSLITQTCGLATSYKWKIANISSVPLICHV